ncbi:EIN3-binding F-box protein 1 [Zea mays]|uniref:EIN3-binding F-box protein 1 n=4 Tax=Zea mays TaxID=4577 RepID=A0A1D6H3X0_MAIZE|nr:F-box family member [Zea mays]AQK69524.1 EIN3-binding F-box protein 1 [Zea mays]PWZ20138.1 EIN3-binding F-box protein 1 [Zea mays]|eukprot:NP_001132560.2 F-box family member [Zea mays]
MPALYAYGDDGCLVSAPAELAGLFCRGAVQQRKRTLVAASAVAAAAAECVRAAKKQRQLPSLDALPDECLFEILRRVPGRRGAAACVSRRWLALLGSIRVSEFGQAAAAADTPSLPDLNEEFVMEEDKEEVPADRCVDRVLEGKEATDVRLAAMAVVAGSCGGLEKLSVRGSHPARGVTDQGLSAVARGSPNLSSLALWDVPLITDAGLVEIAAGCPLLERLDISRCPLITDKGLAAFAQGCPDLVSLTIEACSSVGDEGLRAIGRSCMKLQAVNIKNCPLVGDQGISSLVCSATASLAKIRLQGLNITDASLAVIGYYGKAITDLSLTRLATVGERGFWVMANAAGLQNLRCMSVTSCPGVTDLALASIAKFCPSLKKLYLRKCGHVSDAGLKAFTESAKVFENLQLEECNRVTLVGILAFLNCSQKFRALSLVKCMGIKDICSVPQLPFCRSLRFLTIKDCPGFTNASLAVVGMICPQLEQVDLSGLGEVTDNGLLPLIQSSESGLIKVDLSGCKNITDVAVSSLVKRHGKSLKKVSLEGCSKITDASLFTMSESCTELAELDLSNCMVSDYGVAMLASARHLKLRVLSLSGCSKVTQKSVPFLGNLGQSLEGLNLQFCNMIGNHNIASLEKKLWWCDILA